MLTHAGSDSQFRAAGIKTGKVNADSDGYQSQATAERCWPLSHSAYGAETLGRYHKPAILGPLSSVPLNKKTNPGVSGVTVATMTRWHSAGRLFTDATS